MIIMVHIFTHYITYCKCIYGKIVLYLYYNYKKEIKDPILVEIQSIIGTNVHSTLQYVWYQ
jgi:hypothetical protein